MKSKKLASILMAGIMAASCAVVPGISASAETGNLSAQVLETVKTYKTRSAFMDDVNNGVDPITAQTSEGEWEAVYSFTIADDANVMIYYGYTNVTDYTYWNDVYFNVYSDVFLTKPVELETTEGADNSYYGFLKKGTYYVRPQKNFSSAQTFFLYVGQVKKTETFGKIEYVSSDKNKSVTYKIVPADTLTYYKPYASANIDNSWDHIRWYGVDVTVDNNYQFKLDYDDNSKNSYLNIYCQDINGYKFFLNALCLNPYTANITGIKNKAYTGKAIKQSKLNVKAGDTNADYKVTYKNNTKVGTATMTFKGTNSTIGTVTKSFKIVPGKVKSVSAKVSGKKAVLKWGKSAGAKSYVVQQKVGKKWKTVVKTTKTSAKISVAKGKTAFRVYGTAKVSKKDYNGSAASVKVTRKK